MYGSTIVRLVRFDNGGELFAEEFDKLCNTRSIIREYNAPRCPEFNGVVEGGLLLERLLDWPLQYRCACSFPVLISQKENLSLGGSFQLGLRRAKLHRNGVKPERTVDIPDVVRTPSIV